MERNIDIYASKLGDEKLGMSNRSPSNTLSPRHRADRTVIHQMSKYEPMSLPNYETALNPCALVQATPYF